MALLSTGTCSVFYALSQQVVSKRGGHSVGFLWMFPDHHCFTFIQCPLFLFDPVRLLSLHLSKEGTQHKEHVWRGEFDIGVTGRISKWKMSIQVLGMQSPIFVSKQFCGIS
jgi:hypothetical protein